MAKSLESSTREMEMFPSSPIHRSPSSDSLASTKSITFGKIEIREYAQVIGDNPSCSSGAPISLGWDYHSQHTEIDIDDYESGKSDHRRGRCEMIIPASIRRQTLESYGFSIKTISDATNEAQKLHELRMNCAKQQMRRSMLIGTMKKIFGLKKKTSACA